MSTLDAAIYNEARKAKVFSERVASRRTLIFRKTVTTSEVLTLPAGYYDIIAVGHGGSGGRSNVSSGRATGGGGPGWARDWGKFDTPTTVTFTVGVIAAGLAAANNASNGNTGGTVSVTGITNPISITGGGGGTVAAANATCLGGLGGVATGGKVRANGGRGGNITNTANGAKATGGGAVDLFCQGSNKTRGGDINGTYTVGQATGGGGIGGHGSDLEGSFVFPRGGGSGGDAPNDGTGVGPSITGVAIAGFIPDSAEVVDVLLAYPGLVPTGAGADTGVAPSGGGAGGTGSATLGGGAGVSGVSTTVTGGAVVRGGGSGGVASQSSGNTTAAGGAAFFVVSVYSDQ